MKMDALGMKNGCYKNKVYFQHNPQATSKLNNPLPNEFVLNDLEKLSLEGKSTIVCDGVDVELSYLVPDMQLSYFNGTRDVKSE